MQEKIAVLIINWNSHAMLGRCLECVIRQEDVEFEIFVLDNGSTDSIPRQFYAVFPTVHFYKSDKNLGFAAGNNFLFQKTAGFTWIALVNPDAYPEPRWLTRMISAARVNPDFSFFASRLLSDDDRELLDGDGDILHISGLAWRRGNGLPASSRAIKPCEVFSPCAAAALYRREAFESVGGFDEEFFCYFEDVDLGFRLRLAGYRCLGVPEAVAYHTGSATTGGRHSDFAVYYGHRNMTWNYVKNMPGALFWLMLPLHILLNMIIMIAFFFRGQGTIIYRAKKDALRGIAVMWKKRREIQSHRRVSLTALWKVLDKRLFPGLVNTGRAKF